MYKTVHEAVVFVKEFRSLVKDVADVEIVLAPPFTALHAVVEAARSSNVGVAGQNLHWEREGAFTGEISVGDAEGSGRRVRDHRPLGAAAALRRDGPDRQPAGWWPALGGKLTPIVCIGETLEEREAGQTLAVLDRQIKDGLDGLTGEQVGSLVIAYEPVWAIGTGRNATPAQADEAHAHIRGRLRQWFGGDAADHCHVIYGGSVKPDNSTTSLRCRTWTGPWSAGRASTSGRSARLFRGAARPRYNRALCSTT